MGEEQTQAFNKVKAIVAESIMLTYPDPNCPFDLYPDASSTYAMGAILVQDGKVISTFSRKFNDAQLKNTVTGQELLAASEACKHFGQMIRGCEIGIHTDHQNLTHNDTVHVNLGEQRTRIFLEQEFAPTFVHIAGADNTGADGLSRLPMLDQVPAETTQHLFAISNLNRNISYDFPLDMWQIQRTQAKDEDLLKRRNSDIIDNVVIDGTVVTTLNGKVWVPKSLQQQFRGITIICNMQELLG